MTELTKEEKLLRNISASISIMKAWIVDSYDLWESYVDDTKKRGKINEINTIFKCLNALIDSVEHSDNEIVETVLLDKDIEIRFDEIRATIDFVKDVRGKEMQEIYKDLIRDANRPPI